MNASGSVDRRAILTLIGNTPMIALRFAREQITLHAKCEFLNPSGSIKDRFARAVLLDAEQRRLLKPDSIVLECSSGNTGIALSMVGAAMGYRVAILIDDSASNERLWLMRQFGAEVLPFKGKGQYRVGIDMSYAMAAADSRYFLPRQFENPLNLEDHEKTTGEEILKQIAGPIDAFVTGYGTGATLAGCGLAIKRRWPGAQIIAMEPKEQALLAGEAPCCHNIEGVGDGFIPSLLRQAPLDGHVKISSKDAIAMTRRLQREFGLPVGISSGANVAVALDLAAKLGPHASVVTLLCDRAERYFSTPLFNLHETAPTQVIGDDEMKTKGRS